jgi:hypothetical protein
MSRLETLHSLILAFNKQSCSVMIMRQSWLYCSGQERGQSHSFLCKFHSGHVLEVTPFLQHVDAVVSAAAWRCLRCVWASPDSWECSVMMLPLSEQKNHSVWCCQQLHFLAWNLKWVCLVGAKGLTGIQRPSLSSHSVVSIWNPFRVFVS